MIFYFSICGLLFFNSILASSILLTVLNSHGSYKLYLYIHCLKITMLLFGGKIIETAKMGKKGGVEKRKDIISHADSHIFHNSQLVNY